METATILLQWVRRLIAILGGALVLGLAFIVALQVFQRFVINHSLTWPDELAGLMLAWITFVGAYLTASDDAHIRLAALESKLPRGPAAVVRTLADLLVIGFVAVLVFYSLPIVERTWGQTPITVPISKGLIYSIVPTMATLIAVEVIAHNPLVRRIFGHGPLVGEIEPRTIDNPRLKD